MTHCNRLTNNEFRMYSFVMGNLSGRQQGIQAYHATIEYSQAHDYGKREDYLQWATKDKTVILLDGGGSQQMVDRELELENFGIPYASFQEPDLGFCISAISFLLPEDIYNFEDKRCSPISFWGGKCNLYEPTLTKEEQKRADELERKCNIFKWIKSFRLASN